MSDSQNAQPEMWVTLSLHEHQPCIPMSPEPPRRLHSLIATPSRLSLRNHPRGPKFMPLASIGVHSSRSIYRGRRCDIRTWR